MWDFIGAGKIEELNEFQYFGLWVLILLVYLFPAIYSLWANSKIKILGTDQYYHNLLIQSIKKNKNKFIVTLPNLIGENYVAYPQFLHWILSFFKNSTIDKISKYTVAIFHFLSAAGLFLFCSVIQIHVKRAGYEIGIERLLLLTGVIYSLNPFHYDMINAKNSGISARGIGLFLGQAYIYLVILFMITGSYSYLIGCIPVLLLILLSSTFAIQFILFSTPLYAIFYKKLVLIFPLFIAVLLFYFWMPKVFKLFVKGQYVHKSLYSSFLADLFILKNRYSIWRDFIYDFWVKISEKGAIMKKIKYIATNPIIVFLTSMPSLTYVVYLWYNNQSLLFQPSFFWLTSIPALCCFVLFAATSFRSTRFLGEPERYLEFALGLGALMIAIYYRDNPYAINLVLTLSLLFICFRFLIYKKALRVDDKLKVRQELLDFKELIISDFKGKNNPRVLYNNMQASNILMSLDLDLFRFYFTQKGIKPFSHNELFTKSFSYFNEEMIIPIIKNFEINFLIVEDGTIEDLNKILNNTTVKFKQLKTTDNLLLYKVSSLGK